VGAQHRNLRNEQRPHHRLLAWLRCLYGVLGIHRTNGSLITPDYIDKYLATYTLEEILELNELTESDILLYLVEQEFVKLPNPKPCDLDD
jgi:hypothetical protein